MGAHSTAWVIWVNAVEQLTKGVTVNEAGHNLEKFFAGIIADAQEQPNLSQNAQNGQRRASAKWSEGTLSAWIDELKGLKADPWTASSVQAYAQAGLAFVNMLPGTTRAGKSTLGLGEGTAWQRALAAYNSKDEKQQTAAKIGNDFFDAGTQAWVRPRHMALMELALGGVSSPAWQSWPPAKT
jgi:hypothetical protein